MYTIPSSILISRACSMTHLFRNCRILQTFRPPRQLDRKSTRLNSSHLVISYAVFCLKKKNKNIFVALHIVLASHAVFRDVDRRADADSGVAQARCEYLGTAFVFHLLHVADEARNSVS